MNINSLLFVHGWATDKWVWEPYVPAFKNMDCANINLPGHGGREQWDSPTLEPAVREIARQIKVMDGNILGVGWSLGAQALLASALENTGAFKGLILIGATPSFVARAKFPWGQSKALVKRMIMDMKKDPGETLQRFYPLNFTEMELGKEVEEFIERYRYPGPISCEGPIPGCFPAFKYEELTLALAALYSTDLRERLGEIELPVLIVHGKRDVIVPIEAGEHLASMIKGARLQIYEEAGHAPFMTEMERFKGTIKKFMGSL